MSLFEDWYITYFNTHPMDYEETFRRDNKGEYYHRLVFMMYKAFLAGKILHEDPAPVPKELFERIDVIKKKAEANKLREQITTLDATTAFEMIENPPEPNEKLIELLRLE